jgi:uncharacterized protein
LAYKVDLKGFMARCETNYLRLCQIFPDMSTTNQRCLRLAPFGCRKITLTVKERTRYTTLLAIEEEGDSGARQRGPGLGQEWCRAPVLTVRAYHDAKLVEVVSFDSARRVRPSNHYPNKKMLQRDEKAQWNRFLEEWLIVFLQHGYIAEPTMILQSSEVP